MELKKVLVSAFSFVSWRGLTVCFVIAIIPTMTNMTKHLLLIFCGFVVLSGCSRQMIDLTSVSDRSGTILMENSSSDFFLGGLLQSHTIDAVRVCGGRDKVAYVATVRSVQDMVLTWITLGLYAPRGYEVYCKR